MRAEWDTAPEAFGKSRICEKCGKKFTPAIYHQYVSYSSSEMGHIKDKDEDEAGGNGKRKLYYCSYHCYIKLDKPVGSYAGKKIQVFDINGELLHEFRNAQQAAMWLADMGYSSDARMIQRCCRGEVSHYKKLIFKYKEVKK